MNPGEATRRVFSVRELNHYSKELLESAFPAIWVEGEISNFSAPSSGHWYFSLKDEHAQIRCAMFRNRNLRIRKRPGNGDHVLVRGLVSLYTARGEYQLIAEELEPAGLGALQRAFELLKQKLATAGLFAADRKRPLPAFPAHLAVVTSPTGAALRDILTVLRRRFPALPVTVVPVPVQGTGAARDIAAAIALLNRVGPTMDPPIDVMIVGRGGGSLEDLWAFNEEILAQAIHGSAIPVVSAVGHETDITIADLVADVRAPTPSAAAEIVSPDAALLAQALRDDAERLTQRLQRALASRRQQLEWLSRRMRHPGTRLREQAQRLDELELRLRGVCQRRLQNLEHRLAQLRLRMSARDPERRLLHHGRLLEQLRIRLLLAIRQLLRTREQQAANLMQLLDSVSPLATLNRGYAIVTDSEQRIIRDARSVPPGAPVRARLARGELHCRVDTVQDS